MLVRWMLASVQCQTRSLTDSFMCMCFDFFSLDDRKKIYQNQNTSMKVATIKFDLILNRMDYWELFDFYSSANKNSF